MTEERQLTMSDGRDVGASRPRGVVWLALRSLRRDGGTQLRKSMSIEATKEYAEALERGEQFPAVTVFDDGESFWLSDGFHRYDAHSLRELELIQCEVLEGTRQDAILYAAKANRAHGVRLTPADREKIVLTLVNEFPQAIQADIARMAAIDRRTVANIMDRLGCQIGNSKGGPKPGYRCAVCGRLVGHVEEHICKVAPDPTPIEVVLASVPEGQREAIEELLTAPMVPPDLALEAAQNLAAMPEEKRERVAELAASSDTSDREAAVAAMRRMPYTHPSWAHVNLSLDHLRKARPMLRGTGIEKALPIVMEHVEGLLEAIQAYERSKLNGTDDN